MDQMKETKNGERFLCFAYEPNDPSIHKKKVLRDMDKYWMEQNRKKPGAKKRLLVFIPSIRFIPKLIRHFFNPYEFPFL
jgi:hypothetical protein